MVKLLASGEESPVDMAFNDIFEVIQEIEEMPNAAQIVPGREDKSTHGGLADARIYGSDLNLAAIKSEPREVKVPCVHSSQFSQWVNMSINADKLRAANMDSDQLFQRDFAADHLEDARWGEKLISETKNLFQFPTTNTRSFVTENYRSFPAISSDIADNHMVPEFDCPSWFEHTFTDELLINKYDHDELNMQDDSYLSEYSSDSEPPPVKQEERLIETLKIEEPLNPWTAGTLDSQELHKKPPPVAKMQVRTRCKTSFKSGRPRLCQFLLELLDNPDKYSSLIEWLDKEKGIFKFLNSSRVAQEWGTRRNKPRMKYENFARSLRTYIAKGILTKPRSKLVYRFSSL